MSYRRDINLQNAFEILDNVIDILIDPEVDLNEIRSAFVSDLSCAKGIVFAEIEEWEDEEWE